MSISGSADLTKTLPTGILIPSMSDLEPIMGSQAAWRKLRKALILLAGLLYTEHSEVGMLYEILSDAELTAVLAPAPLARQNFQLTPFVAAMNAGQVSLATYNNKQDLRSLDVLSQTLQTSASPSGRAYLCPKTSRLGSSKSWSHSHVKCSNLWTNECMVYHH